jgi:hypothetical protein
VIQPSCGEALFSKFWILVSGFWILPGIFRLELNAWNAGRALASLEKFGVAHYGMARGNLVLKASD